MKHLKFAILAFCLLGGTAEVFAEQGAPVRLARTSAMQPEHSSHAAGASTTTTSTSRRTRRTSRARTQKAPAEKQRQVFPSPHDTLRAQPAL